MDKTTNKLTLLYLTMENMQSLSSGVRKKILGQIRGFERLGFSVAYVYYDGEKFVLCEENKVVPLLYRKGWFFGDILLSFVLRKVLRDRRPDVCYIRYWKNLLLYKLFKRSSKLIVEIPTINIEQEILNNKTLHFLKRLVHIAVVKLDKYFLSYPVDYFVNFEGVTKFSNTPAFSMNNCIDISNIPLKKEVPKESVDGINLIAVASMSYWQGYERIIKSLGEYKRRQGTNVRKVRVILVGDGMEIPYYRNLVEKYGLQNDVEFCGSLFGKKLDEKFERADVALGGFGMYKIGVFSSSKLKIKEYCARGLPIVDASNDRAFTGKEEFVLQIPNDTSEINMEEIVAFYDQVSQLPNLSQRIRKFSEENFDWTKEFQRFFKVAFNVDLSTSN